MLAAIIGLVTLILGATSVFAELQSALDRIWRAPAIQRPSGMVALLRSRLLSFGMVVALGFLLLVSLVIDATLTALSKWGGTLFPATVVILQGLNLAFGFGVTTLLFAMAYRILPRARIAWSDVWVGATVTAVLFTIGKYLVGLYLGKGRRHVGVWCRGLAGDHPALGLLLRSDFPLGSGVHVGVRPQPWLEVGNASAAASRDRSCGVTLGAARSVFARALHFDEGWLGDSRPLDTLPAGGPFRLFKRRNVYGFACVGRLVKCLHDANVLLTFFAGWLRLAILPNAIREIEKLRRELVALADPLSLRLAVDRELVRQRFGVFVRRVGRDLVPWSRRSGKTPRQRH